MSNENWKCKKREKMKNMIKENNKNDNISKSSRALHCPLMRRLVETLTNEEQGGEEGIKEGKSKDMKN